jgi:hypothetical protein
MLPAAHADQAWPRVALPGVAHAHGSYAGFMVDGRPTHIQSFVVPRSLDSTVAWFRRHLGSDSVVNRLDSGGWVVGRLQGDYYLSVELSRGPGNTTSGVAVVSLFHDAVQRRRRAARRALSELPNLPSDAHVLRDVESRDGDRREQELVIDDSDSLAWNARCLSQGLRASGMRDVSPPLTGDAHASGQRLLEFRSRRTSVVAVLHVRRGPGTVIVVQWVRDGDAP